jgi:hypothetical protein
MSEILRVSRSASFLITAFGLLACTSAAVESAKTAMDGTPSLTCSVLSDHQTINFRINNQTEYVQRCIATCTVTLNNGNTVQSSCNTDIPRKADITGCERSVAGASSASVASLNCTPKR